MAGRSSARRLSAARPRRDPFKWGAWLVVGALAASCAVAPSALPPLPTLAANPTVAGQSQVSVIGPPATPTDDAANALTPNIIPNDVPPGEHVAANGSLTETETEAAGPMLCRIQRDSCAFRQLIIDRDPGILFSESEPPPLGEENRMMHPAMQLPLARLAALVRSEWNGQAQLMVTAAYDSEGHHDLAEPDAALRYSLHYEGRSIDLITLPPDRSRNSRLCSLALHAGFDWVHNEIDHCHASVSAYSLCTVCSPVNP